jgi:hypothetical protein
MTANLKLYILNTKAFVKKVRPKLESINEISIKTKLELFLTHLLNLCPNQGMLDLKFFKLTYGWNFYESEFF